jgi:hypothetical protein
MYERVEEGSIGLRKRFVLKDPVERNKDRDLYEEREKTRERVNTVLLVKCKEFFGLLLFIVF